MLKTPSKRLGEVLQQAGLISAIQIEIALRDQTQVNNMRIGEILASRGWIKQETADFFAERWPILVSQKWRQPLGQYLLEAGLLNAYQIKTILFEQTERKLRFGELAVLKGWIEPTTINFFLEYLACEHEPILQQAAGPSDNSQVPTQLLNFKLVVQQRNELQLSNRMYQSDFYHDRVEQKLEKSFQPLSLKRATSIPNKLEPEKISLKTTNTIGHPSSQGSSQIWRFLGTIGLLSTVFVVCFNVLKRVEVQILFNRSNELLHKERYQQAITSYNQILKIDSNYYEAWTNRGYALAGLQEYNKMLESCSTANIIEPRAVYAWNCQGEALYNLKQYEQAITAFDKAIHLDSGDHVFWINKSESLLALKQFDKALVTINKAIDLLGNLKPVSDQEMINRSLSVAFSHKGQALSEKQEYEQALEAYNQALTYDPHYLTAQQGRGMVLQDLGRYNEAIVQFNQILKESKLTSVQETETLYYLELTLCHASDVKKGRSTLEKDLKPKPDEKQTQTAKKKCG
jgi:tetratricopeptide (TPR) repeat protein